MQLGATEPSWLNLHAYTSQMPHEPSTEEKQSSWILHLGNPGVKGI